MNPVLQVLGALLPSAGVAFLFWLAMRSIIGADRRERLAMARLDAQEAARPNASEPTAVSAQPADGGVDAESRNDASVDRHSSSS